MIAPVLIVVAVLCAMVPLGYRVGISVGRQEQRGLDVHYISSRAQQEMRQSWRDIAWELKERA